MLNTTIGFYAIIFYEDVIKMERKSFTQEEIEQLSKNPYIKNVGEKGLTYTKEFKERFLIEKAKGKKPTQIFREAGFDTKLIGRRRIDSFNKRVTEKGIENLDDKRTTNSGRIKTKDMPNKSLEEEIKELKHKNALLEQENEFLKKMKFLNQEMAWLKSLQERDTK